MATRLIRPTSLMTNIHRNLKTLSYQGIGHSTSLVLPSTVLSGTLPTSITSWPLLPIGIMSLSRNRILNRCLSSRTSSIRWYSQHWRLLSFRRQPPKTISPRKKHGPRGRRKSIEARFDSSPVMAAVIILRSTHVSLRKGSNMQPIRVRHSSLEIRHAQGSSGIQLGTPLEFLQSLIIRSCKPLLKSFPGLCIGQPPKSLRSYSHLFLVHQLTWTLQPMTLTSILNLSKRSSHE